MTDIVERLEKWLEKDQVVAYDWDEEGFAIDGDIEMAIEEIKRLRKEIMEVRVNHDKTQD